MLDFERLEHFYHTVNRHILKTGTPWAKYILLNSADREYLTTKRELLDHPYLKKIVNQLHDTILGINSLDQNPADFRIYNSFYWTLRFLADVGLSADELKIAHLIRRLQLQQLEDGQFMLRYHKKRQQTITLVCMTAHLCYCLIRLGYRESPSVAAALKYLISSQRSDGSWHCDRLRQNGERDHSLPGCIAANIQVVRALGSYGDGFENFLSPTINHVLSHSRRPATPLCIYESNEKMNLSKLRYPPHFTGLDILNVIDSLSYFSGIVRQDNYETLVSSLLTRWDGLHFLHSEKRIPGWSDFDFSHNNRSSDWITALFLRVLKRTYFES